MDDIIRDLVEAGYYRARISTLSDFDKIIGGLAWAMQIFSCDLNIDIFYTDTLDLGQKIALTERLVMVLIVIKCPHQIEPHQIVGLDFANLVPVVKWLIKKSAEVRREHEAFNRLLALRHYFRVTNSMPAKSLWSHSVPVSHLKSLRILTDRLEIAQKAESTESTPETLGGVENTRHLLRELDEKFKDNKQISFVNLASLLNISQRGGQASVDKEENPSDLSEVDEDEEDQLVDKTEDVIPERVESVADHDTISAEDADTQVAIHRELDNELLATNQKILNLLKKLDSMPSDTEISQYQKRYIELHQQLIGKNKDVKKVYALYNSLESTKHYLTKEINLLDSIASNLDLTENSSSNRDQFLRQFQEIVSKILDVKEEVNVRLDIIRRKCDALNEEHEMLSAQES